MTRPKKTTLLERGFHADRAGRFAQFYFRLSPRQRLQYQRQLMRAFQRMTMAIPGILEEAYKSITSTARGIQYTIESIRKARGDRM